MRPPFTHAALVENPVLLTSVVCLLSDKAEIDTFSAVTSKPGAPE